MKNRRTWITIALWIAGFGIVAIAFALISEPAKESPAGGITNVDTPTARNVEPWDICRAPTSDEKTAVYAATTREGSHLYDPWAVVRHANTRYIAATLHLKGLTHLPVILVRYPVGTDPLTTMRAVNGTAQSYTNLPATDGIGRAGQEALDCVNAS